MIPVTIDISSTLEEFRFSKEDAQFFSSYLLDNIAEEYMQRWEKIVDNNLKGTREAYKSGMRVEKIDEFNLVFSLEGKGQSKLGLMIETGADPWDMKDHFKLSSKRKETKDGGWYLTIPFKIATAEAIADSPVFAGKMTKQIQKVAKGLSGGESLNKMNVPKELQIYGKREEITGFRNEYKHKSFMFEGLQHNTKSNHGGYIMFRRISDESDADSWIHKGFKPHNFMEQALNDIQLDQIFIKAKREFINI